MNHKSEAHRKRSCTEILSRSEEETRRIGAEIGRHLQVPAVVLLRGALGTGKTTLTRGIAEGLGLKDLSLVSSPSFTLVNIYHAGVPIYHVDLYRVGGERDLCSIGLDEFFGSEGVTIVEWSERLLFTVSAAVEVTLEDLGDDFRSVCVFTNRHLTPQAEFGAFDARKRSSRGRS